MNQEEKLLQAEKKSRSASWKEEIALEVEKYGYCWASTKKDAFQVEECLKT